MGDQLGAALWLGIAALVVWIIAPAAAAEVKGYDPERWFLAWGVVGVIALGFFPRLPRGRTDEQAADWRRRADRTGAALSALQVAVFLAACGVAAWRTYGPR